MSESNLLPRIFVIIVAIPLVLLIIFLQIPYSILFALFLLLLCILSSNEYVDLLLNVDHDLNKIVFMIQTILIYLLTYLYSLNIINLFPFFIIVLFIVMLTTIFYLFKKEIALSFQNRVFHIYGFFYIVFPLSFALWFYINFKYSAALFLIFLIIVWSSNIFGYLFGLFWLPRKSLNLPVSPNKSLKGFIGAILFGTLIPFLLNLFIKDFFKLNIGNLNSFILIFITNIFSIIGDLLESGLKRFCKAKDSSNKFKGFGGILDMIDSILFAFPFFALILLFFLK